MRHVRGESGRKASLKKNLLGVAGTAETPSCVRESFT